ncbi:Wzz/FepE/Etk N-terminal domain-containing protein [Alkalihalobacillus sp. MEB130]|uniref:YveK family protein n=1 Tax=Alkalihalobacillus sp. MEB130 TaxID=2976704 RepID=UPI0028E07623|nr:Wzz/FepE/Etk N-terminal domain-containing protein [Alkalihalobacillus sp. MEB130]MDT8861113.1 Wzz/FepE/Etk N-terminal domain-containing protein [Alkalihalobacillus sp. MEB130]
MEQGKGNEIDIRKIFDVIRKRLWMIVVITVITTSAGAIYNHLNKPTPIYDSTSRIMISETSSFFDTLRVVITEPPVLEAVIKELQLNQTAESLRGQINVSRVDSSQIVAITVTNPSQEQATIIANTVANVYKEKAVELLGFEGVEIFAEAVVRENAWPINPASNRIIKLAFAFGIVVGLGLVFLLDSLDNRFRSERQIEKSLELPVLGSVSKMNKKTLNKDDKNRTKQTVRGETIAP